MENKFPGMWHRWYRHQCVAVGWHSKWGYKLNGKLDGKLRHRGGWQKARKMLSRIKVGHYVIVALQGNRVGRLGQVTDICVEDGQWEPLVPRSKRLRDGEMGRRVYVRWDLACGPEDRDLIVRLPERSRFTTGELRPTISEIRSQSLDQLRATMNDAANWVGLLSHFRHEQALSEYIAAYPHHLEDGLVPHTDAKVREKIFSDRTRLDVLLLDREERPVIVECKQGAPYRKDLTQLRHYMALLKEETGQKQVRGILVHGGARKLHLDVLQAARQAPPVEIVQYSLKVDFASSDPSEMPTSGRD